MGTVTIAALFCGIIVSYLPIGAELLRRFTLIGYILLIANIVISEFVIWRWRYIYYISVKKHELDKSMP